MKSLILFFVFLFGISFKSNAAELKVALKCFGPQVQLNVLTNGNKNYFQISYFNDSIGKLKYPKELPYSNSKFLWETATTKINPNTTIIHTPYVDGSNADESEIIQFRLHIQYSGAQKYYTLLGQWREAYFSVNRVQCN